MKQFVFILAIGCTGSLMATPPAWWTTGDTAIIQPGATPSHSSPANAGQLKNVAKKAALYLNNTLPAPGAGPAVNNLVASFQHNDSALSPITLGQLKAVSKPFFDRLIGLGYNTKQNLINHGVSGWALDYPWDPASPKADNLSPANLGQLKLVFSFDLTGFSAIDTDGDGLTNAWETAHGLSLSDPDDAAGSDFDGDGLFDVWEVKWGVSPASNDSDNNSQNDAFDDFDGDGLCNQEEATFDLNPYSKDTDKDDMPDDWELDYDFDPSNAADAAQDIDEDGYTNLQEYQIGYNPAELVEPEPSRKVELWFRAFSPIGVGGTEVPGPWFSKKWIGPGSEYIFDPIWMGGHGGVYGLHRAEYYFKNFGSSPATARWIIFDHDSFSPGAYLNSKLIQKSVLVPAGNSTSLFTTNYPAEGNAQGLLWFRTDSGSDVEHGFDDFERYAAPGTAPNDLPCPWLMVPSGQGENTFRLYMLVDDAGTFKLRTTSSAIHVEDDEVLSNGWETYTVTGSGETGENDYVVMTGQDAPAAEENKAKIVRVVKLPKIECTVQPYVVTLHGSLPSTPLRPGGPRDFVPQNLPSKQQLQAKLNDIYEKQMNVHFTVEDYIPLGPMDYDIGAGSTLNSQFPNLGSNRQLDIVEDPGITTAEENAIYTQPNGYNPNVINIYFLPADLGLARSAPLQSTTKAGLARFKKKAGFIAGSWGPRPPADSLKKQAALEKTVAHEIGHLGMLPANVGVDLVLKHPRKGRNVDAADVSGFPLRRLSDDLNRLMWLVGNESTDNLLIKEEWIKFRASKQQ